MAHKTKNIVIKKADVDKHMVPIVKWLNSFDGVTTLWCCQGNTKKWAKKQKKKLGYAINTSAYVMFTCTSETILIRIMDSLWNHTYVKVHYKAGLLRYTIEWKDRDEFIYWRDKAFWRDA